jgi:hypothetical protein
VRLDLASRCRLILRFLLHDLTRLRSIIVPELLHIHHAIAVRVHLSEHGVQSRMCVRFAELRDQGREQLGLRDDAIAVLRDERTGGNVSDPFLRVTSACWCRRSLTVSTCLNLVCIDLSARNLVRRTYSCTNSAYVTPATRDLDEPTSTPDEELAVKRKKCIACFEAEAALRAGRERQQRHGVSSDSRTLTAPSAACPRACS